ncbi:hypothetical protein Q604_UNBC07671G0001, partial [human gut metagenome]
MINTPPTAPRMSMPIIPPIKELMKPNTTALTMIVFYLIAAFAAGSEFVATLSGDMSPYLYAVMSAMNFGCIT